MSVDMILAVLGGAFFLWFVVIAPCLPEREDEQLLAVAQGAHFDAQWWAAQEQAENAAWREALAADEEDRQARRKANLERELRLVGYHLDNCNQSGAHDEYVEALLDSSSDIEYALWELGRE